MTEENEYTVCSTQPNGSGVVASIEGVCLRDRVVFHATLLDANDSKQPLGFLSCLDGVRSHRHTRRAHVRDQDI